MNHVLKEVSFERFLLLLGFKEASDLMRPHFGGEHKVPVQHRRPSRYTLLGRPFGTRNTALYFCFLLAVRLKEIRQDQGLTQIEAARLLKRPQSFVAKCEKGTRTMSVPDLLAFGQAYQVSPLALLIDFLEPKTLRRLAQWVTWKEAGNDNGFAEESHVTPMLSTVQIDASDRARRE